MWGSGWVLICVTVNISPLAFWWSNRGPKWKREKRWMEKKERKILKRQKPNKLGGKRLRNAQNKPRKMVVCNVYLAIYRHLAWMPLRCKAALCKYVFNSCSFCSSVANLFPTLSSFSDSGLFKTCNQLKSSIFSVCVCVLLAIRCDSVLSFSFNRFTHSALYAMCASVLPCAISIFLVSFTNRKLHVHKIRTWIYISMVD